MLLTSFILSVVSIISVALVIYVQGQKEIDEIEGNFEEFEALEELEKRIDTLEYSAKAHTKNVEILASQISDLQVETLNLKNQVNALTRQLQNTETSFNNLLSFVDKTRGMVNENTTRINKLEDGRA